MSKIKFGGFPDKDNQVTVFESSTTYIQECDQGDELQELKVSTVNEAGEPYFVIETERWAFDDIDELINVLKDFKEKL